MVKIFKIAALLFILASCRPTSDRTELLRDRIEQILAKNNATVGVSIVANAGEDTVSVNGDIRFPLQSVFKFHIALAVLSKIDKGEFSPDQKIEVRKSELLPGLWSPLREKYPDGGTFPISELIQYSVSQSDNVSCDVLLRLLGGPQAVEDYFRSQGFSDISIRINEEEQQGNRELMFQNWTTPNAANEVLIAYYKNENGLLSKESHDFVWKTMAETETGLKRLKGQLPEDVKVAHKTGSSGVNQNGVTEAVNDIGVIFLPGGAELFISVFVSDSKENEETNERIIAELAKAAYDHFTTKEN